MIDATLIDARLDHRGALLRQALVLLVLAALVVGVLLAWGRGTFRDEVRVTAQVDDIGGALATGSDVKLRGVIIGRVTSIETRDGGVRLGLQLSSDRAEGVPRSVRARILPASVFGTSFVDLVPPRGGGAKGLVAGQVIRQDRRSTTLELQDSLDSTFRVMSAVKPAQLAETLGAIADALDGRGAQLGETMETLNAYVGRLEQKMPLVTEDLRLLAANLDTIAEVAPDVLDAVDSGLVTARTIVAKRAQLTSIISGGTALADEMNRLQTGNEKEIVATIRQSAVVVDALHDERAGIPASFRSFAEFARKGQPVFADGPFMNTDVFIKTGGDRPYTAADCPVFGDLRGDNCGGASRTAAKPAARNDDAVVDRIRGVLSDLDRELATDDGVGELLLGPYVEGGGAR